MQLLDALKNVVRSPENDGGPEIEALVETLQLREYPDFAAVQARLHGYWLIRWMCTDTWVGLKALYLGNYLVGYTTQNARKSDVDVKFLSVERARLVEKWLIACIKDESNPPIATAEELGKTIHETFTVNYTNQILDHRGFVAGERADFVAPGNRSDYIDKTVSVRTATGALLMIAVKDFHAPIHITGRWPLEALSAPAEAESQ